MEIEINKTNKGLLAIATLSVVVYLAFNSIKKKSDQEKKLGQTCKRTSGPDGLVIYDFNISMSGQNTPAPNYKCKRCNTTGCSTEPLETT
jgi:hypothetical protein